MTLYDGPGVTPMRSDAEQLYSETPILIETIAAAVGTSNMDVAFHMADTRKTLNVGEQTALLLFLDEFVLTT